MLGGALTQSHLSQVFRAGLLVFGSAVFGVVSAAQSYAQNPVCASGIICQGSGCSQDENNPTDKVNLSLAANEVASIEVTRLDNNPVDASACALSFSRPGSSDGQFTAGLLPSVPTSSGQTAVLTGGQSTTVEYTANSVNGHTIDIGPPTASGQQNCQNPAIRKAFQYTVTAPSCNAQGPTLRLEKAVDPAFDTGQFNLFIKSNDTTTTLASATNVMNGGDTGNVDVVDNTFYRISESAGAGTSLTDYTTTVTCGNGASVQAQGGDDVRDPATGIRIRIANNFTGNAVCTITNTRINPPAKLTIIKETDPDGDPQVFDFTGTGPGGAIAFDLQDNDPGEEFTATGAYSITETGEAGYTLTDVACLGDFDQGGGDSASTATGVQVTLDPGEEIVCTFSNRKQRGSLTIIKETDPDGDPTVFTFTGTDPNGAVNFNLKDNDPGQVYSDIGSYSITEGAVAGYDLTDVSCTGDFGQGAGGDSATVGGGVQVTLEDNETIVCTFTNEKQGASIQFIKETDPDGDPTVFTFNGTDPNGAITFDLKDNDPAQEYTDLGSYSVTEAAVAGYGLTDVSCTGDFGQGAGGDSATVGGGVQVTLEAGENVVCTFTNRKLRGSLQIIKETDPDGDPKVFTFTGTDPNGAINFNLKDNDPAQEYTDIGSYSITEGAEADYDLTDVSCTGDFGQGAGGDSATVGGGVQVTLEDNETIVCTFFNARQTADLRVEKQTIGGNGSFNFTVTGQAPFALQGGQGQTFTNLPTGQYVIEETNLPAGWTLQSISNCGTVNLQNRTVTVDLTTNGATCTFTNFKDGDDPMEEETNRFIHRRVDNLLTYGPDRARMLRRLREQPREPGSLKDGPLKVTGGTSGGMGLGAAGDAAAPMGSAARRMSAFGSVLGDNPFKKTPLPGDETDEEAVGYGQRAGPSVFSEIASQFAPLANGRSAYNFSTSLSAMRQAATEAELRSQQKKVEGLGLESAAYLNPYVTDRNQGLDVWVEGHIAKYDDNIGGINREGNFRLLYIGADYLLAPGVLVGALVQIDDTNEDIKDPARFGKIDGTGWMAGPYVGVKLRDNLFFDARAAWGRSDNDILLTDAAAGTRSGNFDTDRWLASASLTGSERFGAWRISPQLTLAYGSESSDAYTNSLGQSIASTDAKIGRLTGTTEIGYRIQRHDGTIIEPHVAISGIWNFDTDDLVINGVVHDTKESRAKVDGGILITTPSGWGVRGSASYDGIGADDYEAVSGSLWLNIPLN